jgi:hypothetical protein
MANSTTDLAIQLQFIYYNSLELKEKSKVIKT